LPAAVGAVPAGDIRFLRMLEPDDRYEVAYAIARLQIAGPHARGELRPRDFAVVKVLRSEQAAREETERLNSTGRQKGCIYFYQATRLQRA